jgi:hypothetical protein
MQVESGAAVMAAFFMDDVFCALSRAQIGPRGNFSCITKMEECPLLALSGRKFECTDVCLCGRFRG